VFSITIAALSLAAGQMGPRLLRNFSRINADTVIGLVSEDLGSAFRRADHREATT
jgi:uncharacterized membrane protein